MMVTIEYDSTEFEAKGIVALDTLTQLLKENFSVIRMDQQRRIAQVAGITWCRQPELIEKPPRPQRG